MRGQQFTKPQMQPQATYGYTSAYAPAQTDMTSMISAIMPIFILMMLMMMMKPMMASA